MGVLINNICIKKNKISGDVYVNGEKNLVWYEFPWNMENITVRPANAFLVAFMPIAMKAGGTFEIEDEISENLYNQMSTYQDILSKWYYFLNKVEIKAKKISKDITFDKPRKTISCFTGGVDAFYTLLKHKDKIDDLLYVWGFDIPLTEEKFYNQVKKHLSTVSKKMNKNLISVKTNLGFEVTNKYASWNEQCNGGAIASVILLMSSKYELCFIPSSNDYSTLIPRGSHVLTDYLRGCDNVNFIYDGAEASRIEKVDFIADNKVVQEHLRVCYMSNSDYNCSKCEKCIRTMSSLEALDKLDKISTFHKPFDIENINKIPLANDAQLKFAEDTMKTSLKNNHIQLANQLNTQIINYKTQKIIKDLNENFDMLLLNDKFIKSTDKIIDWHLHHNSRYTTKKFLKILPKKIKNKLKKR